MYGRVVEQKKKRKHSTGSSICPTHGRWMQTEQASGLCGLTAECETVC